MAFSCQGCGKRFPGCHDTCEKYKAEKAAYNEKKKMQQIQTWLDDYQVKATIRSADKRGRKWGGKERGYSE